MKVEWNRVTWYSKLFAVLVFLATFAIAFDLGALWEKAQLQTAILPAPVTGATASPVAPIVITQADQFTTIKIKVGAPFEVSLGTALSWNVSFSPAGAVAASGSSSTYKAVTAGTITLTATGAPICKAGEACPQFRQQVTVTLVAEK